MLIKTYQVQEEYNRVSKNGKEHTYVRKHSVALLKCDSCGEEFERRSREMDHRRLTANHFHICPKCPAKSLAQKKGTETRRFWNTTVDHDIDIDSL